MGRVGEGRISEWSLPMTRRESPASSMSCAIKTHGDVAAFSRSPPDNLKTAPRKVRALRVSKVYLGRASVFRWGVFI